MFKLINFGIMWLVNTLFIEPLAHFVYTWKYHTVHDSENSWSVMINGYLAKSFRPENQHKIMDMIIHRYSFRVRVNVSIRNSYVSRAIVSRSNPSRKDQYNDAIRWLNSYLEKGWSDDDKGQLLKNNKGEILFYRQLKTQRMQVIRRKITGLVATLTSFLCGFLIRRFWFVSPFDSFNGKTLIQLILSMLCYGVMGVILGSMWSQWGHLNRRTFTTDIFLNRTAKNLRDGWFYWVE